MNRLDVYLHQDLIGHLDRLEQARLSFSYTSEWVERRGQPLSASLPLRSEEFTDSEARPYFAGLLPEGRFLRDIARVYSVSAENSFSVLEAIGGECAGAISLVPAGEPLPEDEPPRWMYLDEVKEMIQQLPTRPLALLEETDGLRLSLAGAQEKLPVMFKESRLGITRGFPPSTYIMKIPDRRFPGLVANEAYCMNLAGMMGISVAPSLPLPTDPENYQPGRDEVLIVRRFDRITEDDEAPRRLHQEDFCQAMGVVSEEKYEADGGPGFAACAELLRRESSLPARDLIELVQAAIFNFLIGNHDAHGKNFSMLREGEGSPRFAPLYDLVSTASYDGLDRKMAMKIGGESRPEYVKRRHWERFAEQISVSPSTIVTVATVMLEHLEEAGNRAKESIGDRFAEQEIVGKIDQLIDRRAGWLRDELDL